MIITKLDRRHRGHHWFKYHVVQDRVWSNIQLRHYRQTFNSWRQWCNETFGPGCERDWAIDISADFAPVKWGWCTDDRLVGTEARLYLKSEEELTIFKLKWD